MARRFLQIAVVYLLAGALLGLTMGIRQNFSLTPVHAHTLLLGWASLALAGLIYHLYPAAGATRLAKIHFWLHNLALPVFMIGLAFYLSGKPAFMPAVAGGATLVVLGIVFFTINVLRNVRSSPSGAQ